MTNKTGLTHKFISFCYSINDFNFLIDYELLLVPN
jgi:hypothetical protein